MQADDPGDRSAEFSPTWTLRATFYWEQTFPASKAMIVDHRYKPIGGGVSVFADEGQFKDYEDYCFDDQGKAGVRRLLKQAQAAARADSQKPSGISPVEVSYVLTAGANWKGPIGNFHKEKPHAVVVHGWPQEDRTNDFRGAFLSIPKVLSIDVRSEAPGAAHPSPALAERHFN